MRAQSSDTTSTALSKTAYSPRKMLRVSNFDSTAQRDAWWEFMYHEPYPRTQLGSTAVSREETQQLAYARGNGKTFTEELPEALLKATETESFWSKPPRLCQRYMQAKSRCISYFAGVLRTAYLYNPRICLTDAELFDGIFFQALGPNTIHKLLGLSYKDRPVLFVHGRGDSLHHSLCEFVLAHNSEVLQSKANSSTSALTNFSILRCSRFNRNKCFDTHSVAPHVIEQFHALHKLCHSDNLSNTPAAQEPSLTHGVVAHTALSQDIPSPQELANLLCALYKLDAGDLDMLAQRWQEWIDAEKQGIIVYQQCLLPQENAPDNLSKTPATCANTSSHVLTPLDLHAAFCGQEQAFRAWVAPNDKDFVEALLSVTNRSEAFRRIDARYPSETEEDHKQRLRMTDLYQFAYQYALSQQHHCDWIGVQGTTNSFVQHLAEASTGKTAKLAFRITHPLHEVRSSLKRAVHSQQATKKQARQSPMQSALMLLSSNVTKVLGEMPASVFTHTCYTNRDVINRWRTLSNSSSPQERLAATKEIDYAISMAGEQTSRADVVHQSIISTSVVGASALVGAMLGLVQDDIVQAGFLGVLFALVGNVVCAILPDVRSLIGIWWEYATSDTKTVITPIQAKELL